MSDTDSWADTLELIDSAERWSDRREETRVVECCYTSPALLIFVEPSTPPVIIVGPYTDRYDAYRSITVIGKDIICPPVNPRLEFDALGDIEIVFQEEDKIVASIDSSRVAYAPLSDWMSTLLLFLSRRELSLRDNEAAVLPETRLTLMDDETIFEVNGVNLLHAPMDPCRTQLPTFLRDRELGLRGTHRRFVRQGATYNVSDADAFWPIHWQKALWRSCGTILEYANRVGYLGVYIHIPTGVGTYTDIVIPSHKLDFSSVRSSTAYGLVVRVVRQ